jgi:hypothetical protein
MQEEEGMDLKLLRAKYGGDQVEEDGGGDEAEGDGFHGRMKRAVG